MCLPAAVVSVVVYDVLCSWIVSVVVIRNLLTFVIVWIVRMSQRSSLTVKRIRVSMGTPHKANQYIDPTVGY